MSHSANDDGAIPDDLRQALCDAATDVVACDGRRPVLLSTSNDVWVVLEGSVHVFATRVAESRPTGARHHLFQVEAGRALFGRKRLVEETGLVAIGRPDTRVARLRRRDVEDLDAPGDTAGRIREWVDAWVNDLSARVAREYPDQDAGDEASTDASSEAATTDPDPDTSDETQSVDDQGVIRPSDDVRWVRHTTGRSHFLGRTDGPSINGEGYFPVSSHAWLRAEGDGRFDARRTDELGAWSALWEGLDQFHDVVLDCTVESVRRDAERTRDRIRQRAGVDQRAVDDAFGHLASVLDDDTSEPFPDGMRGGHLGWVCTRIGTAMDVDITVPDDVGPRVDQREIHRIARTSNVRARRVLLRSHWWTDDNGPLLAWRTDDPAPVALLPVDNGTAYEMHDPTRPDAPVRVDAEQAERLHPQAYTFYRPLPDDVESFWDLLRFGVSETNWSLWMILGASVGAGLLGTVPALVTGELFDLVIPNAEYGQLAQLTLALAVSAVAVALFEGVRGLALVRVETKAETSIHAAVWDRLLNLPVHFFRSFTAGELADKANAITQIRQVLTQSVVNALLGLSTALFNGFLLVYYDVELAGVALLILLVVVAVTVGATLAMLRYERDVVDLRMKLSGLMLQLITGMSKLRVAGAESRAFRKWAETFGRQRRLQYREQIIASGMHAFNAAAPVGGLLILFFAASSSVQAGTLSTGSLVAFVTAFTVLLQALVRMSTAMSQALMVVPLYEKMRPILQARVETDPTRTVPATLRGEVDVRDVTFRYDEGARPVLRGVSFHADPGEFIAFVGPSGSGKSTLLRLLIGFESPEAGSIRFDGQPLQKLDQREVRRQMGVVLQEARLMSGTIASNVAGVGGADEEAVWAAARKAGLAVDVKSMPMGIHTTVTQGGSSFSGGQRQRVLLARALFDQPNLFVLDEATSALDNEAQDVVGRSLQRLDATRIVVAHRLSTVRDADRIYMLDDGRVVESGTYRELMDQEGAFADLARRQMV